MRILVTGAAGMLGVDLCAAITSAGHAAIATDIRDCAVSMDITAPHSVGMVLDEWSPDAVVHCAAWTNVDGAESDPAGAWRLNALGSGVVAQECASRSVPVCAISTDFVFDGTADRPYTEFDLPCPLNVYGASKLAGEQMVRSATRRHWILRTAWLYGLHGKCFPDTIIRAAASRPKLKVVADQVGCPTWTVDLANTALLVIERGVYGTYHAANSGCASWYEFAASAVRAAGLSGTDVHPITTADWPAPAQRPRRSVLKSLMLELQGLPTMRPWSEAFEEYMAVRAAAARECT